MTNTSEEWRPIPGHPDYEASNLGRVRSWKGKNSRTTNTPRIISPHTHKLGYLRLTVDNARTSVHQLVAAAFHGPCPEGMEVDHINNIKADNRPENLRYLTRRQNMQRIEFTLVEECKNGHPMSGDNVYIRPSNGRRECRKCSRIRGVKTRTFGNGEPCTIAGCDRIATCLLTSPTALQPASSRVRIRCVRCTINANAHSGGVNCAAVDFSGQHEPRAPRHLRDTGVATMSACETCWNTAYRISRMTGRPQAEVYQELIKANPSDGSHAELAQREQATT